MYTILNGLKEIICSPSFHVFVSFAGPDGETGQPSLWRRLRESEESLSQTAAVSGDGEAVNIQKS